MYFYMREYTFPFHNCKVFKQYSTRGLTRACFPYCASCSVPFIIYDISLLIVFLKVCSQRKWMMLIDRLERELQSSQMHKWGNQMIGCKERVCDPKKFFLEEDFLELVNLKLLQDEYGLFERRAADILNTYFPILQSLRTSLLSLQFEDMEYTLSYVSDLKYFRRHFTLLRDILDVTRINLSEDEVVDMKATSPGITVIHEVDDEPNVEADNNDARSNSNQQLISIVLEIIDAVEISIFECACPS